MGFWAFKWYLGLAQHQLIIIDQKQNESVLLTLGIKKIRISKNCYKKKKRISKNGYTKI